MTQTTDSPTTNSRHSRKTSGAIYRSGKQSQSTPRDFYESLNDIFGFDLDVASEAALKCCERFYDEQKDGLEQPWSGTCWCNPPWRRLHAFVRKACAEVDRGRFCAMLCPIRSHTKYWQQFLVQNPNVACFILCGRLKFGNRKTAFPHSLCLLLFVPDNYSLPPQALKRMKSIGLYRWGGSAVLHEPTSRIQVIPELVMSDMSSLDYSAVG